MNAHALLTSQGWRGTGHSLHPTSDRTGLSRPILVSQKQNNLGVGKKQHKTSDMWWMNAFDKSLQGLDTSKDGAVVQTVTNGGLDMVAKGGARFVGKGGGLYASFVSGGCLTGTLPPEDKGVEVVAEKPVVKKRKRDEVEETKEERRARRAAKRELKAQKPVAKEGNCAVSDDNGAKAESKEERKERRRLKKLRKTVKGSAEDTPSNEEDNSVKVETKEERKERRRQKKLLQATEEVPIDASEKAKKKKRRKE